MPGNAKKPKYKVLLRSSAAKDLDRLDDRTYQRTLNAIRKLGMNLHPPGSKKIHTKKNMYRLRVGDYRVLYEVVSKEDTIIICRVVRREKAYREI